MQKILETKEIGIVHTQPLSGAHTSSVHTPIGFMSRIAGIVREIVFINWSHSQRQLGDFARSSTNLFWQRQFMFLGVACLSVYYYNPKIALVCYAICLISEIVDLLISQKILSLQSQSLKGNRRYLILVVLSSIFSATAITGFAVAIAWHEGPSLHFTPLFLLFSAALFAAVNNHQIPQIILIKLIIYGLAFLYIPLRDLIIEKPQLNSSLWLQFLTVLFVLYFVIDCCLIFLRLYRKNLEQLDTLKIERDKAMVANAAKNRFLATVSHEIRTPLTSIKGSLDLIEGGVAGELPESVRSMIRVGARNTKRLLELINELLDFQKLQTGGMDYSFTTIDLRELIWAAREESEGSAARAGIELQEFVEKQPIFAEVDRKRLLQVLSNMISNAIKFSKEGCVVDVGLLREPKEAVIFVRDYGIGIPENSEDLVFEPFSQVDTSDSRQVEGTGLGMSISREIVSKHGGSIAYKSELGKGTTFCVRLRLTN